MQVIIGVDPHKAIHTAVAIGTQRGPSSTARRSGPSTAQVDQLLAWAEPFEQRTWAIEGADGLGYLLAQQLVAAGETRAGRAGDAGGADPGAGHGPVEQERPERRPVGRGHRAAHDGLRQVAPGRPQPRCCACWRSATTTSATTAPGSCAGCTPLLVELDPGGIAKEINASDVDAFLAEVTPATPVEQIRYDLAVELLDDIRRLDDQIKASHKRIRDAVAASGTTAHRPLRDRPDHRRDAHRLHRRHRPVREP